jgi:uncharacterized SAM-binding protein YcdF (DUF218 family)
VQNTSDSTAVILGAAVWPDGKAAPTLQRRTDHAGQLFQSGRVQQIIVSGGLGKYPPSEAIVMHDLCAAAGVPKDHIILEDQATNTLQNIQFSSKLVSGGQFVIVTDAYHVPRAWLTARVLGLNAVVSAPPMQGTKLHRVIKSWLREGVALPFYVIKLAAKRLSGQL